MQQFIDVHSHLLNFRFVSDGFFKTRSAPREWFLRRKGTAWLARVATVVTPGPKYDKLHEVLDMMRRDFDEVARILVGEMKEANIVLSTPLMMDLEIASFHVKPECPYRYQVKLTSDMAIEHPGRIMPFIMFDPRRKFASKATIEALDKMGFLGVKMYPPLGYHPDPSSFCNADGVERELETVYGYCEENSVPITTHCSKDGGYSSELMRCMECARDFCRPSSWKGVLQKHPALYLNFAHFGGNDELMLMGKDRQEETWCTQILDLMKEYDNVYADLSYHSRALSRTTAKRYFPILKHLMGQDRTKDRIIFGTDWPMTRHTWTLEEYVKPFIAELAPEPEMLDRIAFQNPLRFLFPGRKLPQRISEFFASNGVGEDAYPPWMEALR